jgi:hypothetical protein
LYKTIHFKEAKDELKVFGRLFSYLFYPQWYSRWQAIEKTGPRISGYGSFCFSCDLYRHLSVNLMLVYTWNLLSCYRLARVILPIPSKRKGLVENFWELRLTFVLEQIHLVRYGSSSFFCFHVLVGCSAFLMMNNITHLIWQACFILSFFQWILFFLIFLSSL